MSKLRIQKLNRNLIVEDANLPDDDDDFEDESGWEEWPKEDQD